MIKVTSDVMFTVVEIDAGIKYALNYMLKYMRLPEELKTPENRKILSDHIKSNIIKNCKEKGFTDYEAITIASLVFETLGAKFK